MTSYDCFVTKLGPPHKRRNLQVVLLAITIAVANAAGQSAVEKPLFATVTSERISGDAAITPFQFQVAKTPKDYTRAKRLWALSGVVLTVASLVDFRASIGHREGNPALRDSTGEFSVSKGISLKLGLAGATLLFQSIIGRHRPDSYGPSGIVNVLGAGVFGAAAAHDANTPR